MASSKDGQPCLRFLHAEILIETIIAKLPTLKACSFTLKNVTM